ncbi:MULTISPECIES: VC0807 family protein [Streptomyces]|uniref:VC0807 family protein n=1 Tax=Streptomyces lonegramiae TaxID=3075524 RepID=A0ABU2XDB9_9ACTN|nr:VC0807 family protein [Streptomyces sp. DSM 41529]MDT0542923.1 VC0807 family protein [Streptomyces sp. DSM 41529]
MHTQNTAAQSDRSTPDTQPPGPDEQPTPPARSRGAALVGWVVTIALNVVAPIVTYNALHDHGWSEFSALLVSGAWPVLDSAVHFVWRRHLDEFAVVTLVFLVISAVMSLVGAHSARALLVKDSAVTGLFGLLCLATLLAPRPLMFYFGRKFATDGTEASTVWWNDLWQYEGFRRTMMTMTAVWGVAYLLEAGVRAALAYVLSTDTMVVLSPVLIYGVLGALALWTGWYAKRSQRKGEELAAAAATAQ